jgi:hypothetical protein
MTLKRRKIRLFHQHDDDFASPLPSEGPFTRSFGVRGSVGRLDSDSNTPQLARPRHNSGFKLAFPKKVIPGSKTGLPELNLIKPPEASGSELNTGSHF